jgi:NodT family efflux transporter outer membrane factor (OMF) lipoprotein
MSIMNGAPAMLLDGKSCLRACGLAMATAASLLVAGCNFGPTYQKPQVLAPDAYKEASLSKDWKPADPQDAMLHGKWWEVFKEPELNHLEEQLNIDNQNIAQYFNNFVAARSQVAQTRASYWPTVSVGISGTRSRTPPLQSTTVAESIATTANTFQLPLSVSWQPDLFGRIRNSVKEYSAAAQVSAADLENERLSEQASLAEYYFELRGQDALIELYNKTVANYRETLELTQARQETGLVSDEDVASAEANLKSAEASATALANTRAQYEHAIALLIGKPASQFSLPERALTVDAPTIPVGLPSQLLERRPDIAASERTIAQANALIGIGKAAYFPTLSISAAGGTESPTWSNLYNWSNYYWSLGPSFSETVFDGGKNKATLVQYRAQYNGDVAKYRQTVLNAFKEVEDYLVSVRILSTQIRQQDDAIVSAQRYYNIANSRYETGLDTYLNVLSAQNTLLTDRQTAITLRVNRITASVQLIQALGGGWDSSQLPSDVQLKKSYTTHVPLDTSAPQAGTEPARSAGSSGK